MVNKWAADFKHSREMLEDDPRLGMPVTITTQENIAKIHDIIMADRQVTEHYIATELDISQDCIHATSTTIFICLRCQHVVSQNSLNLNRNKQGLKRTLFNGTIKVSFLSKGQNISKLQKQISNILI